MSNQQLNQDSLLLGSVPELDSMAIMSMITALEENFDIILNAEDISADHFESVRSLATLIKDKMNVTSSS